MAQNTAKPTPSRGGLTAKWGSLREASFDVLLVLMLEGLILVLLWPLLGRGWFGMAIEVSTALVLLLRRIMPLTVLGVMLLNTIALAGIGRWMPWMLSSLVKDPNQGWLVLAVPFAVYAALVYGADQRRSWVMITIITLVAVRPWDPIPLDSTIAVLAFMLVPALLGHFVAGLNDRVERAEREQHRLAEQARVEERVRLAAEMHDVVTHRISLMVLQAGALGVTATDAATRAAAEDLRNAGCQALEELRDLVGVLRSSTGSAAEDLAVPRAGGQAGVPDFSELLAESESVGVPVTLEREGDPSLASPVVARTAYRIIQEALTNVRKHAPGATTLVRLNYGADRVVLTVRNTAPEQRVDPGLSASGSGTGLLGLLQRVELVSGTLRARPTDDGGFQVEATLPAYVPTRDDQKNTGHVADPQAARPRPRRPAQRGLAAGAPFKPHRVRGGG